jgi:hypothetical protein
MDKTIHTLDSLSEQEEMLVKDGLMDEAANVRERMTVITIELDALASELKGQGLLTQAHRDKVAMIMARQLRSLSMMKTRSAKMKEQMAELSQARAKLATMRNTYGRRPGTGLYRKNSGTSSFDARG